MLKPKTTSGPRAGRPMTREEQKEANKNKKLNIRT